MLRFVGINGDYSPIGKPGLGLDVAVG